MVSFLRDFGVKFMLEVADVVDWADVGRDVFSSEVCFNKPLLNFKGYQQNAPPLKNTIAYNFSVNNQNPAELLKIQKITDLSYLKNAGFLLLINKL